MHQNIEDRDLFDGEEEENEPSLISRLLRNGMAAVAILGMLFLGGGYQYLLFQRTSPEIVQEQPSVMLDAEEIVLPVRVFIMKNGEGYGSERDEADVARLMKHANTIWEQGNIRLDVDKVVEISATRDDLQLFSQDPRQFITVLDGYDPTVINVFLLRTLDGINGVAFRNIQAVAVADFTTVYDFRTLAHEIGHILSLGHVPNDRRTLMYGGANGFILSPEEISRARVVALQFTARL